MQIITPIALEKNHAEKYAVIVAQEEMKKKVSAVKYLGGGSFGKAYGVTFDDGQSIVVKFLRAKNMIEKEVFDLNLLVEHSTIATPKVLFERMADDAVPVDCYGMEKVEGKTALMSWKMWLCSKRKKKAFAEAVVEKLHKIHQCTNEKFGDTMNPTFDTWQDCYKPFAQDVLEYAEKFYSEGKLSKKIIDTMRLAWDKFDLIFSEKVEKAVLIHGDLNLGNIMVDKHCNLSGFIDPLNSMYADREYDLFQFDNFGKCFKLSNTYMKKYGASKYCREKLAFYGLWNEVYCYMKSGVFVGVIMNPLVKNMNKVISRL